MTHQIATDDAVRWLRQLPAASVDLALTDPPYSSGGYNESGRRSGSSSSDSMPWLLGDGLSTPGICYLIREVALELRRVVKGTGALDMFTDFKMAAILAPVMESAGWRYRSLIVWDKTSQGSGQGWMPQHELIMHFGSADTAYLTSQANVVQARREGCPRARDREARRPARRPHAAARAGRRCRGRSVRRLGLGHRSREQARRRGVVLRCGPGSTAGDAASRRVLRHRAGAAGPDRGGDVTARYHQLPWVGFRCGVAPLLHASAPDAQSVAGEVPSSPATPAPSLDGVLRSTDEAGAPFDRRNNG